MVPVAVVLLATALGFAMLGIGWARIIGAGVAGGEAGPAALSNTVNGEVLREPTYLPAGFVMLLDTEGRGDTLANRTRVYGRADHPRGATVKVLQGGSGTRVAADYPTPATVQGHHATLFQPGRPGPAGSWVPAAEEDWILLWTEEGTPNAIEVEAIPAADGSPAVSPAELVRIADGLRAPTGS